MGVARDLTMGGWVGVVIFVRPFLYVPDELECQLLVHGRIPLLTLYSSVPVNSGSGGGASGAGRRQSHVCSAGVALQAGGHQGQSSVVRMPQLP